MEAGSPHGLVREWRAAGSEPAPDADALRARLAAAERRSTTLVELTSLISEWREPVDLARRCAELAARTTGAAGSAVYIWNADDERLVLRGATEGRRRDMIGRIRLRLGEGITGWSALMRQTVVVPTHPLSDPRAIRVPELGEDPVRSMLAVPILDPGGDVLGVFSLHAMHEHAFSEADLAVAGDVGVLLASGLLQARTVSRLRTQSAAARFLSGLPAEVYSSVDTCLRAVTDRIARHMEADACVVELSERLAAGSAARTELVVDDGYSARLEPAGSDHCPTALAERARRDGLHRLRLPLGPVHPVGAVTCYRHHRFSEQDVELAEALGAQAAAALLSVVGREVVAPTIDRLLDPGDGEHVDRLLAGMGWKPAPTRVFVVRAQPAPDVDPGQVRRARTELCRITDDYPGSVVVSGTHDDLIFLSGVTPTRMPDEEVRRRLARLRETHGIVMIAGVGPVARTATALRPSLHHAVTAARWAELTGGRSMLVDHETIAHLRLVPGIVLSMSTELHGVIETLGGLVTYDLVNGTDLAKTLDAFVANRGSAARTAAQLFIHRNTLRQRLRRIEELTGQSPEAFDNWLTAGLAARVIEESEAELAGRSRDDSWCPRGVVTVGSSCCGFPVQCALCADLA